MAPTAAAPLFGSVRPVGARGDGMTLSVAPMPDSRPHFEHGSTSGEARLLGRWPSRSKEAENDMVKMLP